MKKIIIIILLFISLLFTASCKLFDRNIYDSEIDEMEISFDDDRLEYDVFLIEEQRHIYIPKSAVEIIVSYDNEIVVVEEKHFLKENVKMYIYIEFKGDK